MRFLKNVVTAILATASIASTRATSGHQYNNYALEQRDASPSLYPEEFHSSKEYDLVYSNQHYKRSGNLAIYVAFGKRRNPGQALHWMIVTVPEGSTSGATYYHVTGGPTQNKAFTRQIAAGKRLDSNGIGEKFHIGTVPDKKVSKVKAASKNTPVPGTGQNCQNYVVGMIQNLEAASLVEAGWGTHFKSQIEHARSPTPETSTSDVVDGKDIAM